MMIDYINLLLSTPLEYNASQIIFGICTPQYSVQLNSTEFIVLGLTNLIYKLQIWILIIIHDKKLRVKEIYGNMKLSIIFKGWCKVIMYRLNILKKKISLIMALVVLMCTIQLGVYVSAETYFSKGNGTSQDPYQISSVEELKTLADLVNNGNGGL